MAGKFDLKDILNQRSKETDMQEKEYETDGIVELVDIYDMIPSKDNFYDVTKHMDLVNSIKLVGILQPLLLSESEEADKYDIKAGHRRREACLYLVEQEGLEKFRYIPSIIKPEQDDVMSKLTIIMANRFRDKSDWEKMKEAIETMDYLKELQGSNKLDKYFQAELKEILDIDDDQNMKSRDFVARILGTSSTQIGRFYSIYKNLCMECMEAFKQKLINVSVAAEMAGLSPERQMEAYELLRKKGSLQISDITKLKQQEKESKPIEGQQTLEEAIAPKRNELMDVEEQQNCENDEEVAAEPEQFEANPEYKDILCYSCLHYAECYKKAETVFTCASYVNKAQAEKTTEQLYSEEQDRIDRETARKIAEMRQEEVEKNNLPTRDKREPRDDFEITITTRQYADIYYGHVNFMVTLNKGYQFDDTITLKQYIKGEPSGKEIIVKVKNVVQSCTGITDGYCVIGFYIVSGK